MSKIPRIVPISVLRQDAALVLKSVQNSQQPLIITQRGRAAAIMLSVERDEKSEHEREWLRLLAKGEKEIAENQGYSLDSVLKERGLGTQIRRVGALDKWTEAVGEKIAGVTRARAVVTSTLFVEVRSSAWLMELNLMKGALLERINEQLGKDATIERIVLTLMEGDG